MDISFLPVSGSDDMLFSGCDNDMHINPFSRIDDASEVTLQT